MNFRQRAVSIPTQSRDAYIIGRIIGRKKGIKGVVHKSAPQVLDTTVIALAPRRTIRYDGAGIPECTA